MSIPWIAILVTVLGSGLVTLLLGWIVVRLFVLPRLRKELEASQDEFERRVRAGVEAAGRDLLPAFREQVKLGFQDALRSSETGELVEGYASVVNRGADLISDRIGDLFGAKRRK